MAGTCNVPECSKPQRSGGWCNMHYRRWRRSGSTDAPAKKAPPPKRQCTIPNCEKVELARGWCRTHYTRWYETGSTDLGVRPPPGAWGRGVAKSPLEDRFFAKVHKTDTCWLWLGAKTQMGYGSIRGGPGSKSLMAHRVSWMIYRGPLSDKLHIDHLCRNHSCVNPDHLAPVTRSVNALRGYAGSVGAANQLAKTACPQGHPYSEENTYITKRGNRMCKTCLRVRTRARRAAKKQGVPYVDPYLRIEPC